VAEWSTKSPEAILNVGVKRRRPHRGGGPEARSQAAKKPRA
jgi:hypothetical protein